MLSISLSQEQFCATHGGSGAKEKVRVGCQWPRATSVAALPAHPPTRWPAGGAHPHRPRPVPARDRLQVLPHNGEEGRSFPETAPAESVDATRSDAAAGGGGAGSGGPTPTCCGAAGPLLTTESLRRHLVGRSKLGVSSYNMCQ